MEEVEKDNTGVWIWLIVVVIVSLSVYGTIMSTEIHTFPTVEQGVLDYLHSDVKKDKVVEKKEDVAVTKPNEFKNRK
jgi:hypothetical protein